MRWWRRPLPTLEYCRDRYGGMFSYRLAHEGTWVFVSDPEAIKQVFTGDPRLLHAGEANIAFCRAREHSVPLLDEPEHMKERKPVPAVLPWQANEGVWGDDGGNRRAGRSSAGPRTAGADEAR